jgi:hypothetical protein
MVVVVTVLALACGPDHGGAGPASSAPGVAACTHAIHAFIDGKRVDFCAPTPSTMTATAAGASGATGDLAQEAGLASASFPAEVRTQDITLTQNGQQLTVVNRPGFLLWGATTACLRERGITYGGPADVPGFEWGVTALGPTQWLQGQWFNFGNAPLTCDQELAREDVMMCVAQKLADVAESPATNTWTVGEVFPGQGQSPQTWVIPPQATADRFIVRDLAVEVLSALTLDDLTQVNLRSTGTLANETCAELYRDVSTGVIGAADTFAVFQDPTFTTDICTFEEPQLSKPDPVLGTIFQGGPANECIGTMPQPSPIYFQPPSSAGIQAAAIARLTVEANELRAASRLLRQLTEESVEADIGAAAQKRARATDPRAGNESAWGVAANENNSFDTIAHAARVLFGRNDYDLGPYFDSYGGGRFGIASGFPLYAPFGGAPISGLPWPMAQGTTCQTGTHAADILQTAYGPDLSARTEDIPAVTDGQRIAARLLETNGVVIPRAQIPANLATLRQALITQLVANAAISAGQTSTGTGGAIVVNPNFNQDPRAVAIQNLVNGLADGDLRWAVGRTYDLFRLLTNSADGATSITLDATGISAAGLRTAGYIDPSITALGGTVVSGGLPRNELAVDFTARAGSMQVASVCGAALTTYAPVYQDAFALGQKLYQRMFVIDQASKQLSATTLTTFTESAKAEMRSWAGPGWVEVATSLIGGSGAAIGVTAHGLSSILGSMATPSLVLVSGQAWHADCAAGLRHACPDDLSTHIARPTSVSTFPTSSVSDGPDYVFGYLFSSLPANFPLAFPGAAVPANRVYVVVPAQGTQPGRVLGAVGMRIHGDTEVVTVSDLRQKLVNDAMGFAPEGALDVSADCGGDIVTDSRVGESPGFCVGGVPRRIFVPLANSVTSTTTGDYENSWQHYLTLAQDAATSADALGKQLLDLGLQMDMQREEAGEALGKICGTYGALNPNDVQVSGGVVSAPSDSNLTACLSEPTDHVVGLGPPGALQQSDVKRILQCVDVNGNLVTPHNANCDVAPSLYKAVNLLRTAAPGTQIANAGDPCADIVKATTTMNQLNNLHLYGIQPEFFESLTEPFANPTQMGAVAAGLQLHADASMNWTLLAGGTPVMDSRALLPATNSSGQTISVTNQNLWPGCLSATNTTCGGSKQAPVFDRLFRDVTAAGTPVTPMSPLDANESTVVLWRLEGALWFMGVVGGKIPAGMFDLWVPAVNFAAGTPLSGSAPLATIYGDGNFCRSGTDVSNNPLFQLCPGPLNSTSLRDRVGTAQVNLGTWPTTYPEIPSWIVAAYNDHAHYNLVHASNPELGPTTLMTIAGTNAFDDVSTLNPSVFTPFLWPLIDSKSSSAQEYNPLTTGPDVGQYAVWQPVSALSANATLLQETWAQADFATDAKRMIQSSCQRLSGEGTYFAPTPNSPFYASAELRNWKTLSWPSSMTWDEEITSLSNGVPQPKNVVDIVTTDVLHPPMATIHFPIGPSTIQGVQLNDEASVQNFFFTSGGVPFANLLPPINAMLRGGQLLGYQANWSPGRVMQLLVNSYAPPGTCGQTAQIGQALTLSCRLQSSQIANTLTTPPVLGNLTQLPLYLNWLSHESDLITQQATTMFLQDVPDAVVTDFLTGQQAAGSAGGDHGVLLQKIEGDLSQLARTADGIVGHVQALTLAYNTLANQIQVANIQSDIALSNIAVQQIESSIEITNAIASAVTTSFSASEGIQTSTPAGIIVSSIGAAGASTSAQVGAAIVTDLELQKQGVLSAEAAQQQELRDSQVGSAIGTFNSTTSELFTAIRQGIDELNSEASDTRALLAQLKNDSEDAAFEAGKASGADFVRDANGNVINYAVNTVLRRQYDVTGKRYQLALDNAKYLAYLARLSIEQRFGIRLDEIRSQVGVLDPPALWADDVCNLSGVDYQTLRTFDIPDGGSDAAGATPDQQLVAQFADQFIGDYVNKLANFVQYYNIEHPSHQGTDTTVLSLKQDLLPPKGICFQDAPNMLFYSGNLTQSNTVWNAGVTSTVGWVDPTCASTDSTCTQVVPAAAIDPTIQGPSDGPPVSDVTWLLGSANVSDGGAPPPPDASTADAAADGAVPDAAPPVRPIPPTVFGNGLPPRGTVWQALALQPGTYLLSWWDEARNADGSAATAMTAPAPYVASVLDPNWAPLVESSATAPVTWGARHVMMVPIANAGTYAIAVTPTVQTTPSSFLIAGMQLEFSANAGAGPTGYIATHGSRQYSVPGCRNYTASDLQLAFKHDCDPDGKCYHELLAPVHIDTTNLVGPGSPLSSKFAAGNYNYRDISLAVNLVGTGVRDCTQSPTPDCFGTGYIEYTLVHDAMEVSVLNASNKAECFNFGAAAINHGKALAAERYITLPIGSADQQLLSQDSIQKLEFQGRPIDGNYKLRIWDSPALSWTHLQDVQVVVTYLYWSAVNTKP